MKNLYKKRISYQKQTEKKTLVKLLTNKNLMDLILKFLKLIKVGKKKKKKNKKRNKSKKMIK